MLKLPQTVILIRLARAAAVFLLAQEGSAAAQSLPLCIPGTPFCARANGNTGVQVQGAAQGQAGPAGVQGAATGNANANANATGNATGHVTGDVHANATGNATGTANANATGDAHGNMGGEVDQQSDGSSTPYQHRHSYKPIRFGAGLALCGTVKAGVYSGLKLGPCFAVSFRTEPLIFEMETQLLFGGTRHSIDWVFPMSFVIPLTTQRS
ncbi:MAG TPA: hypothetical protein VKP30_12645, partial [Polyangiaceae bacterium]|nr:hypothetical protein [Polyangiaceae bacterium]